MRINRIVFRLKTAEKIYKLFARLIRAQSGSVAVITAMSMVALLGFSALVLDLGASYHEASGLQNALDSAALAALRELPADNLSSADWAAAKIEAMHLAAANNIALTSDDIEPVYENDLATNHIIGIKVQTSVEVDYNFAKVLGIDAGTVTRTAAAGLTPVGAVTGAIPLSITASSLDTAIASGTVTGLTIKCSSNADDIGIDCTGVNGWFGPLRFAGSGACVYSDLIAHGYSGMLQVGQVLNIESGNMSGPTLDGFRTRYDACTHGCTADCYEPDCPKLVYIPVVEVLSHCQVKIVSFAAFFLEECGGCGRNSYIKATYIEGAVLPDTASGAAGQDFGLYTGKLLN